MHRRKKGTLKSGRSGKTGEEQEAGDRNRPVGSAQQSQEGLSEEGIKEALQEAEQEIAAAPPRSPVATRARFRSSGAMNTADAFLAQKEKFQLGDLPTECRIPKPGNLSDWAKEDVAMGLNTLREVDLDALRRIVGLRLS